MKTLITHINPHLDDIGAIWLFRRFQPDFKEAQLDFVSASLVEQGVPNTDDTIYLGIARGPFDEHKGDLDDSACSLVGKYLSQNGFYPPDVGEKAALEELVEYIRLEDLGRLNFSEYSEFTIQAFIRPNDNQVESSKKATELGEEILDRVYKILIQKHQAITEWESRQEVETSLGKMIAIPAEHVNRAFCKSHHQMADLFLIFNPKEGYVQYYSDKLDLEPIYNKVKQLDPEAGWFLHQSHHMVICGGGSAPDSKKTKLGFEALVEAAK